ncbi:MAG TPA: hypothetical protein VMT52_15865 [Planctomycetota bacterium]|nr:hypothetical protein [Planctomycetota bacterium]
MSVSVRLWPSVALIVLAMSPARGGEPCEGRVRTVVPPLILPMDAPQGMAVDGTDGTLWIASAISNTILHVGTDLTVLDAIEAPFAPLGRHEVGGRP